LQELALISITQVQSPTITPTPLLPSLTPLLPSLIPLLPSLNSPRP